MSAMTCRAVPAMSTLIAELSCTARKTSPVATVHSAETSAAGSRYRNASTMPSEIWSQILSGWPAVTDSDEKTVRLATARDLPERPREKRKHRAAADQRPVAKAERSGAEQPAQRRRGHGQELERERAAD